ncbi:MAG: PEP-CTERM sorting domain-containing protein [Verrucomicrobiae bacterium]|nr:PEP-CTERM sorting domain-containing protein [Verrucomicrobiae bacterium]NNJ86749.1 PEP-CTERM sorting domain-containing protein [Akkermansiaceae bacterium]
MHVSKPFLALFFSFAALPASAQFDITINYVDIGAGGINNSGITATQQIIFNDAVNTWESYITGYQPSVTGLTGITIDASGPAIDGAFNVLGSAGPTGGTFNGGYVLTTTGKMEFDSADLSRLENDGELDEVILHEMGHVLGIGTWWNAFENNGFGQDLYTNGTGQYTGANALAQYQTNVDPTATFIPVELDGGGGTANGHWNESLDNFRTENVAGNVGDPDPGDGAPALTITNVNSPQFGNSLDDELMTGVLSPNTYISNITLGSFEDLGYTVQYIEDVDPVPEPSSSALLAVVSMGLLLRRKR